MSARICSVCGCSDLRACTDEDTGERCHWVNQGLCSFCAEMQAQMRDAMAAGYQLPGQEETAKVQGFTMGDMNLEIARMRGTA